MASDSPPVRMTAFSSLSITGAISGRGYKKVLEIRSRENQHLACAVDAVEIVAFAGLRHLGPALKVGRAPVSVFG